MTARTPPESNPQPPPVRLRLGTRRSPLAVAQSSQTARALEALHHGLAIDLVPVVTAGDVTPGDLAAFGGKGLFTEELERGLLGGNLDLAVHSLKDLPVVLPAGLAIAAFPERADARDVLVSTVASSIEGLPAGAVILTGSLRRRAQLLLLRPDLDVRPLRGNVDTRLRRWRESGAAGVVLAAAGLARLGLADLPAHAIPAETMLPAPGQGTLALEVCESSAALALCRALDQAATARAAAAERLVVAAFGGDCTLPLGAWAREEGGALRIDAILATPDGSRAARGGGAGNDAETAAAACIAALRADGAEAVLGAIAAAITAARSQ